MPGSAAGCGSRYANRNHLPCECIWSPSAAFAPRLHVKGSSRGGVNLSPQWSLSKKETRVATRNSLRGTRRIGSRPRRRLRESLPKVASDAPNARTDVRDCSPPAKAFRLADDQPRFPRRQRLRSRREQPMWSSRLLLEVAGQLLKAASRLEPHWVPLVTAPMASRVLANCLRNFPA